MRAITLGSPQEDLLKLHIADLQKYFRDSRWNRPGIDARLVGIVAVLIAALIGLQVWKRIKKPKVSES